MTADLVKELRAYLDPKLNDAGLVALLIKAADALTKLSGERDDLKAKLADIEANLNGTRVSGEVGALKAQLDETNANVEVLRAKLAEQGTLHWRVLLEHTAQDAVKERDRLAEQVETLTKERDRADAQTEEIHRICMDAEGREMDLEARVKALRKGLEEVFFVDNQLNSNYMSSVDIARQALAEDDKHGS